MRVYEQIYTSAPRLLEGGGNLGVVAETREFPRARAASLAPLRAYTMLPRHDVATPAAHPPRLVIGPVGDGRWYGVTRTVFAGADHTGRTTPLTHQVLTDVAEAQRQVASAADWANGVFPLLRSAWIEAPQWIDPPRQFATVPTQIASPIWQLVLPWLAGALFDFPRTGRAVVVVIDPDTAADAPAGLLASLALLPATSQWTATLATHVVGIGDFVREAGLLVTYPGTSFLEQCRQRRDSRAPQIIDLSKGPTTPTFSAGGWGEFLRRDTSADYRHARQVAGQLDALGLKTSDAPTFACAAQLVSDLAAAPTEATGEDWKRLATRIESVRSHADLARWVTAATTAALRALAADTSSVTRWTTLAAVTADPRWPDAARSLAAVMLLDGDADAIDAAADLTAAPATTSIFRAALTERPGLARAALAAAATTVDPAATRRAAFVLSASTFTPDEGCRAVAAWANAAPPVRQQLAAALAASLAGVQQPADIVALGQSRPEALRAIVLPLLLNAMRRTYDATWPTIEACYRDTSIAAGLRPTDYTNLFQEFGPRLTRAVNGWLNHLHLNETQRKDIRIAAERCGLIVVPPPLAGPPAFDPPHSTDPSRPSAVEPLGSPRPQQNGSAGPIRTAFLLAMLTVFACGGSALWVFAARSRPVTKIDITMLTIGVASVGFWLAIELCLRLFIRSPQQLVVARYGRWAMVVLLTLAIVAGAWPATKRAWQSIRSHRHTMSHVAPLTTGGQS